jgi:hypothetical protein
MGDRSPADRIELATAVFRMSLVLVLGARSMAINLARRNFTSNHALKVANSLFPPLASVPKSETRLVLPGVARRRPEGQAFQACRRGTAQARLWLRFVSRSRRFNHDRSILWDKVWLRFVKTPSCSHPLSSTPATSLAGPRTSEPCRLPDATSATGARMAVADDQSVPAGNQLICRLSFVLGGTRDDH